VVLKGQVKTLIDEILMDNMYSQDILNSEGRKVLELIIRHVLREHPELKKVVWKVRRNPTRENVLKLVWRLRELYS